MSGLLDRAPLETRVAWVRDLFKRIDIDGVSGKWRCLLVKRIRSLPAWRAGRTFRTAWIAPSTAAATVGSRVSALVVKAVLMPLAQRMEK
jgi:hypothetical protein